LGGEVLANDSKRLGDGAKIKTIVFDLGGVLFTEGKSVALKVLSREYGYDPAIVGDVLTCPVSREMRKGLISEKAFWSWVEGQIPRDYDAQTIRDEWYKGYALDRDVFELVKRLKGDYRLVAFSENIRDRVEYLDEKYHFRALFDVEIYSYDHHAGKRDPEFLEILLTTLGDRPGEILYIDNSRDVLNLAEQRGLNVVHYTTGQMKKIKPTIRKLGILV
jgi:FMN phosphatase YigB (HAD superfamily)